MTDQEKKMIDKLAQSESDVKVPESLKPKNIEKMLKKKTKKIVWWKNKKFYGGLAAALVLVVSLGVFEMNNKENEPVVLNVGEGLLAAEDYDEVYDCIEEYQKELESSYNTGISFFRFGASDDLAIEESAMDSTTSSASTATSSASSSSSDTNVRTEGVGEADIVKTDGTYLYALQESAMEVSVIDVSTDRMEELSRIKTTDGAQISEFYVKDGKVFLFTNVSESKIDEDGDEVYMGTSTCVETYDISDVKNPKLVASTKQSGFFHTSRIVGDYIYTFSQYDVYTDNGRDEIEGYVPTVGGKVIASTDIYMPDIPSCQYVVVTSMNVNEPDKIVDQKAVLTDYGECYVSAENIYIYETISNVSVLRDETSSTGVNTLQTEIRKISYKDGKLSGVAKGAVEGWINDSFSIDEYDGNLRIVTTVEGHDTTTNSVYVLNDKLEIIGEINGIAKDERVYSARFFGETGYFVTYRETDPLFSVDFSDPENPEIIGKLKIPGFSEYLHFYGEDQLVGIGMDTEEDTGITNGMKISMFDISDPTDVKEVNTHTIIGMYSSDLFWDYKAVLVDYEKNMIGFSCYNSGEVYYIFSYDEEDGFQIEMREDVNGGSYMSTRGVYIGDRFYVVKGNAIESYRMGTFEKIDDILL